MKIASRGAPSALMLCTVVAAAVTPPAISIAQTDPTEAQKKRARELLQEGTASFQEGRYREAAAKFEAAYKLESSPSLLYNRARALEALGENDEAIELYRAFARDPIANVDAREDALNRAELLERIKEPGPASAQAPAATPGSTRAPATASAREPIEPPSARSDDGPGALGWTLLGVTGVALGTGLTLGLLSTSARSDGEDLCDPFCPQQAKEDFDDADALALGADISYGVAALTGIGFLIAWIADGDEEAARVYLTPVRGGASAQVGLSF